MSKEKILKPCPCCGSPAYLVEDSYEICGICEWEDDPIQKNDPNYGGGANILSLNQARKEWREKKRGQVEDP